MPAWQCRPWFSQTLLPQDRKRQLDVFAGAVMASTVPRATVTVFVPGTWLGPVDEPKACRTRRHVTSPHRRRDGQGEADVWYPSARDRVVRRRLPSPGDDQVAGVASLADAILGPVAEPAGHTAPGSPDRTVRGSH